jgi:hypothetical protein
MKDTILLLSQLLAQHAWIKYALEITLLTLGAGVVRVLTLRLFKRWTMHLNCKYKHFLVALVERMITPILVIAVVSAGFNLFPLSGRLLTVLNRSFYVAILAIGIYCVAKAVLILLNQWIENSEGRENFEPAQFVVRVVFGAFGTMIVLENLGISLTAVWTTWVLGVWPSHWHCRTRSRISLLVFISGWTTPCGSLITSSWRAARKALWLSEAGGRLESRPFQTTQLWSRTQSLRRPS